MNHVQNVTCVSIYIRKMNKLDIFIVDNFIKTYIKRFNDNEYNQFCKIFRLNSDFAKNDKDPSIKEILYILDEEFYYCKLRLFYDIVSVIPTCKYIYNSINNCLSNLLYISKYENKKIDYVSIDKIDKHHSIDDICYVYFYWRKNGYRGKYGKLFNELKSYDKIAIDYYKKDNIVGDNNILYCKANIGITALLFESTNIDIDFDIFFFNNISIWIRLQFKKYLVNKLNQY
ncbi:alpha amanitin sensitivity protein [Cotia virus SPAn232]|uniref:Alpha amanitin sensitivity protein n=2 Tax=Cotia virus TaxID=39444 RepID=H6TAD7_9POXV|nr:alpha amanitin sensitivity protein [Cotia virus SPAn232]AFB76971.1 alpha amanitin sensitivity protein [Cotia virus SPAn232]AIT70784.1 alpha amanitin sensitivity protein [Cotia virus]